MENKFVVTPLFLDAPVPELETVVGAETAKTTNLVVNNPDLPPGNKQERMIALYQPLTQFVADAARNGRRPVSVAGDCCTTIAVLAGLQRAGIDPLLIWFDAHGDFNTWETSPSGFLGGMPLAMITGRGEQTICKAVGLSAFPDDQIVLADGRDLDPGERTLVEESAVVHLKDVGDLLEYPLSNRPVYVHFDVDVVNPADAPAVAYLASGGPTAAELKRLFEYLKRTANIVCVSFSSWRPALDVDGRTQAVCMELLQTLVGDLR